MATFTNRTLAYLGLRDLEDDDHLLDDRDERSVSMRNSQSPPHLRPVREDRAARPDLALQGDDEALSSGTLALVRPLVPPAAAHIYVVAPQSFDESHRIGDLARQAHPLLVDLQVADRRLARRMIDFCSGLTYALGGSMTKVADLVFLLMPSGIEVAVDERLRAEDLERGRSGAGLRIETPEGHPETARSDEAHEDDLEPARFDEALGHGFGDSAEPLSERRSIWDWEEHGGDQEQVW